MIKNEREYRITKGQLQKLREATSKFDISETEKRTGSNILAKAELQALKSEVKYLTSQVDEFEELRSGAITSLKASNFDELPKLLIRARIARRLTQRELAERLGMKEQQIQRYESEEYASASLRRLQEIAKALCLRITELADLKPNAISIESIQEEELDWSRFPIKEMYKRQWFDDFSGTLSAALRNGDTLAADFVKSVVERPTFAFHRKRVRSGSEIDNYALFAWECRVLRLALNVKLHREYHQESLDSEWIAKLAKLSNREDGPIHAKEMLKNVGIALVIEPHLTKTYLDGAAMYHDKVPVIGMTLRYDRLDNFWFVLFHELFHVIKHLRKGKLLSIFDDLDVEGEDRIEQEADELAREALIPSEVWDNAIARFVQSEESVNALAADLEISPAIVAGRIRYESDNYTILSNLVGMGEVRNQFLDVEFGV